MRSTDDLEDLLKERSDQYLLYPSDAVWNNIQKELHPARIWAYIAAAFILLFITGVTMVLKKESASMVKPRAGQLAYQFIKQAEGTNGFLTKKVPEEVSRPLSELHKKILFERADIKTWESVKVNEKVTDIQSQVSSNIELPHQVVPFQAATKKVIKTNREEKKNAISNALETVFETARKLGKQTSWQVYGGPTLGYRFLSGEASRSSYQYTAFALSTNAQFPRNVKDVVNHRPGIGFELGTAMFIPINKRISLKAGLQANYNQYQIDAYSSVPEIANYGMNNLRTGNTPISTVSYYSNSDGYRRATLRNEHYMLSLPIGVDFRVLGNNRINFSIGSTIQPTYVFANYSYLLSTNLKNYAKAPNLNRRWNVNSAVEASLNIQQGKFKWSVAPQFRYQILSSFKDKYPIRENLTDLGIKVGIIRTIQ
ncbi:MAG: hypothetical protein RLZZ420_1039 [Bacteroidota bacterium]|jgi:hypothetical protein